jgi:hypothetical protein
MEKVLKVFILVALVGLSGFEGALAQSGAKAEATPAPKPVPTIQGRCLFPSSRALSGIIANEAKKMYLTAGYQQAFVGVRIVIKKRLMSALTVGNITGIQKIAPQTGSPASLIVTPNPGGAPIELGCNAEADLVTSVVLIDSAGKRINGRTTAKVIVQGAFN